MGGPETAARPMNPRIWLAGGGYMGRKANQVVRDMEAYIDLWSSRDGVTWTPVSYVEGTTPETLFSTSESFFVDSQRKYMGKWGHALEGWTVGRKHTGMSLQGQSLARWAHTIP